jgi:hypothetical protein
MGAKKGGRFKEKEKERESKEEGASRGRAITCHTPKRPTTLLSGKRL